MPSTDEFVQTTSPTTVRVLLPESLPPTRFKLVTDRLEALSRFRVPPVTNTFVPRLVTVEAGEKFTVTPRPTVVIPPTS